MTVGYLVFAAGALGAVLFLTRGRLGAPVAFVVALLAAALGLAWRPPPTPSAALPRTGPWEDYVGSGACRACHAEEHASWERTYHRSMTRVAARSTIEAALPVSLELDGRTYEIAEGPDGRIEVVGPDLHRWGTALALAAQRDPEEARRIARSALEQAPRVRREIVLVTGSHHYQAFWVEGGEGRELRQLPFVYLLAPDLRPEERWLPRRDAFLQPPDALPHVARWNANCVQCHSVAGRPGHSEEPRPGLPDGSFATEAVDFGIGCEACHGPGRAHVTQYQSPLARYGSRDGAFEIVQPARLSARKSSAVCGQCHSYFVPLDADEWWADGLTRRFRPGQDLEPSRLLIDYEEHRSAEGLLSRGLDSVFWPDGTIRVGGREYNGLVKSPCFERGVGEQQLACVSCHSMHQSDPDDQLAAGKEGSEACTQCHTKYADRISEHTHHAPESSGSLCYNCHMPRTTYALLKGIRSHRITSPVARAERSSAPNACNLCHLDKSLGWAERWLARFWPDAERAPTPSDDTTELMPFADDVPASAVWLLAGDAAQRVLLADALAQPEAVAISGDRWQVPLLERSLSDPYAAVRFVARRSLRRLAQQDIERTGDAPARPAPERPLSGVSAERLDALSARRDDAPITLSE